MFYQALGSEWRKEQVREREGKRGREKVKEEAGKGGNWVRVRREERMNEMKEDSEQAFV